MSHQAQPFGGRALAVPFVLVLGACEAIAGLSGDRALGPLAGAGGHTGGVSGSSAPGGTSGSNSGTGGDLPNGGSGARASDGGEGGGGGEDGGRGGTQGGTSGTSTGGTDGGTSGASGSGGGPTGPPALATSCEPATTCNDETACTTLFVTGGQFEMGRSTDGADADLGGSSDEEPEHLVTVSNFWLDKYEVTVNRFRRFVEAYDGTMPEPGAGAHPNVPRSGWKSEWDVELPVDNAALRTKMISLDPKCNETYRTWTPAAGNSECLPVNCIDWYLSFAFCIWDGGRLPTEAEWEYAAAGGDENRLYPWGFDDPDSMLAVYQCTAFSDANCQPSDIRPVGSRPDGAGLFGQLDLAGSMMERTRDVLDYDFYGTAPATIPDPLNLARDTDLIESPTRGGNYIGAASEIRAARRMNVYRSSRWDGVGFRCARNPTGDP